MSTSSSSSSRAVSVAVDYRLTLQSFVRASHAAWKSRTSFKIMVGLIILLLIATGFSLAMGVAPVDHWPVGVYIVLALACYYAFPAAAFYRDADHRRPVRFEFGRDAVTYRRGDAEEPLNWHDLSRIAETKEFYILHLSDRRLVAIPKSAFAEGKEQHFRLLAATSGHPIH